MPCSGSPSTGTPATASVWRTMHITVTCPSWMSAASARARCPAATKSPAEAQKGDAPLFSFHRLFKKLFVNKLRKLKQKSQKKRSAPLSLQKEVRPLFGVGVLYCLGSFRARGPACTTVRLATSLPHGVFCSVPVSSYVLWRVLPLWRFVS